MFSKLASFSVQCPLFRTLRRYTSREGNWLLPPKEDVNARLPAIKRKRRNFARANLTPKKRLKKKIKYAAHLDHKMVHLYGQNRTQKRQFRRFSSKKPLKPHTKTLHDPHVHCLFATHPVAGNEFFRHAKKVNFVTKPGKHLESIKVNGDELVRALEKKICPWMVENGIGTAVMDCVKVNHCPKVRRCFEEWGIELYDSAGDPHNKENGFPPVSHDVSTLDGYLFSTFQHDVSRATLKRKHNPDKQGRACDLYDTIPRVWKSKKYKEKAAKAVEKLGNVLKEIIKVRGAPTGR